MGSPFLRGKVCVVFFSFSFLSPSFFYYPYEPLFRLYFVLLGIILVIFAFLYKKSFGFYQIAFLFSLIWLSFWAFLKPALSSSEEKIWAKVVSDMIEEHTISDICLFRKIPPLFLYYLDSPHPLKVLDKASNFNFPKKPVFILFRRDYLPEVLSFAEKGKIITLPETIAKNPKYLGLLIL